MRFLSLFVIPFLVASGVAFGEVPEGFEQTLMQGSLYLGKTAPGHKVFYKEQLVMQTAEGDFVIGFGRDAELEQSYIVETPNGQRTTYVLQLAPRDYKIQHIEGVAGKYVTPPESRLLRIKNDNRQIAEARANRTPRNDFLDGFLQPVDGPITGVYGSQRYFNGKPRRPHYGLDYAAPVGTPVLSPAAGKVVLAHTDMYFSGGTLIVDHGMGITSSFLHLSKLLVKRGDIVQQGQPVAEVGATGRVTGAHLDWRINWGSVRLDPELIMRDYPVGSEPESESVLSP
ncbi:M23 family metallopeptidase [Parendozoicomonas sp. Alg238-R29]|uniref:M23 family metallopeptidase n=1 Tax=Parendozoicomonas sp. Alg238-R29 TaxID=2993446 RepID=UPI00248DB1A6|nr:M23 family metallopeptidase [Parendozoicomonas sp. Alg238-R29]